MLLSDDAILTETPPGQESRLTRAMKAYHLEKARSPEDLPPWLFDESERRSRAPARSSGRRDADDDDEMAERGNRGGRRTERTERTEGGRPRGLRDIYDSAASERTVANSGGGRLALARGNNEESQSGSSGNGRGTDRLRALRAAKKNEESERYEEREASREAAPSRPRVGLPSGPGRRT
jgi:hypothetical protein